MLNGKYVNQAGIAWFKNNLLHLKDGPAVVWRDGSKEWLINGSHHRIDGPAIVWRDGLKEWFINGVRHRIDGPAKTFPNGYQEWWINGSKLTEEEFNQWLEKRALNEKLQTLPPKPKEKKNKI
jgi:hypothetical protein